MQEIGVTMQQKVKKKRPVLMLIFSAVTQKITGLNRMWSLKSLAMLKCESTCSTI